MYEKNYKSGEITHKSYSKSGSLLSVIALLSVLSPLGGCAIANKTSLQNLDKNISAAIDNTRDIGYPNLVNVPKVPDTLKSNVEWDKFETQMNNQKDAFANSEGASSATAVDTDWAYNNVYRLDKNPLAAPAPNENPAAFAARVRAMLDSNSQ